jgi:transcriptional regulator with XRE-family HTH domain
MADKADEIGAQLRRARTRRGLNLERAAAEAQIAPNHLAEFEDGFAEGRGLGPSVEVLERVARVYGLQVTLAEAEAS